MLVSRTFANKLKLFSLANKHTFVKNLYLGSYNSEFSKEDLLSEDKDKTACKDLVVVDNNVCKDLVVVDNNICKEEDKNKEVIYFYDI